MDRASFSDFALSGRAIPIKLRNENGTYMVADVDKLSVRQSHDGSSPNAEWLMERVEGKTNVIRLKSCSGQCLTATYNNKDWELMTCDDGVRSRTVKLKSCPDQDSTSRDKLKNQNGIFWYVEMVSPFEEGTHSPVNESWPPLQRNSPPTNKSSSSSGESNSWSHRNSP